METPKKKFDFRYGADANTLSGRKVRPCSGRTKVNKF